MHLLTDLDADQPGCYAELSDHVNGLCDYDATHDDYGGRANMYTHSTTSTLLTPWQLRHYGYYSDEHHTRYVHSLPFVMFASDFIV